MLLLTSIALATPGSDAQWTVLSGGDPYIECTAVDSIPWCRSTGLVELPIDKVALTLEDMPKYKALFDSISSIEVVSPPDTLHVVLDYPMGFDDRDYVAKYSRRTEGDVRIIAWEAVSGVPEVEGVVRMPRMAGEWRLTPEGGFTRVTYLWQAEVVGALPEMFWDTARKTAGKEALKDIRKASERAAAGG